MSDNNNNTMTNIPSSAPQATTGSNNATHDVNTPQVATLTQPNGQTVPVVPVQPAQPAQQPPNLQNEPRQLWTSNRWS